MATVGNIELTWFRSSVEPQMARQQNELGAASSIGASARTNWRVLHHAQCHRTALNRSAEGSTHTRTAHLRSCHTASSSERPSVSALAVTPPAATKVANLCRLNSSA